MRRQGSDTRLTPPRTGRLQALFDPRSITVLGASDDPSKWGNILARRALESCGDRPVRLVNRRGTSVLGRSTDTTAEQARAALGEPLDLVVVCVPADSLVGAVTDAVGAGARSLVVITAGLAELGDVGAAVQQDLVRRLDETGTVMVGPNCLGLVDTTSGLQLTHDLLPSGDVAVLSQSGNVVLDLAGLLAARGLGVSRFVSVGNQADVSLVDLMASCVSHEGTRAVAVYAEDVVDGRGFVRVARQLHDAGKPVVLLAPGRSAAAARSAVSHTGSLVTAPRVLDAACDAASIRRVDTPTQMADLLEGLRGGRRLGGRRAAVLTDGGGHGAIAADALAAVGLETPVLSATTQELLRPLLRDHSPTGNPVDLAGAGERDPSTYVRALARLLETDEVDGVVVTGYFGSYSTQSSGMAPLELQAAREMVRVVDRWGKPVVVQSMHPDGPTAHLLREARIPVHRDVDRAAAVLAGLARPAGPAWLAGSETALPPPAEPVSDTSYETARHVFARAGVSFPPARTVTDVAELPAAIEAVGVPVVLKALGRVHKSEDGGVVVGLGSLEEAREAYARLQARLRPPAVSVEAMVDTAAGVELVVGCVRDRRFGPVVMVGVGGVFAEVLADTVVALAPVTATLARHLLLTLRGAPLLLGARGRPAVDLDSLAAVVARISSLAAAHPELAELELNPVLATADGSTALDARLVSGALDVAAVALLEGEDPGVLGGEDPVVEGA